MARASRIRLFVLVVVIRFCYPPGGSAPPDVKEGRVSLLPAGIETDFTLGFPPLTYLGFLASGPR